MKLVCKICNVEITKKLTELQDFNQLNEVAGEDYIPSSFYVIGDGVYDSKSQGKIIVNIKDLINTKHHSDTSRLNGCCGLDGLDGINTVCINNHELGTENSDCWMSHYVSLEQDLIVWVKD
jgi:hypothetical protein